MFSKKEYGNKKVAKGFTLVEIIVVLVILAILAAATIPSLLGFIDDAKFKTIDNEARVVRNAAQAYATEQSAKGEMDEDIQNQINGVINSNHALHNLLQNDASGTVFMTKVECGKIKRFNYTKEIIDQDEDFISDKVRYVVFDDEKTSLLHATDPITNINIDNFKAKIIEEVTTALTSNDPQSFKSTLTSSLNSSLDASVADMATSLNSSIDSKIATSATSLNSSIDSKLAAAKTSLKTNFGTELGSNVVNLVYPVGSYYVSHSSTSPQTLFPGTTWTQITDRFLYCANSSGTVGGTSTHTHGLNNGYAKWCIRDNNRVQYSNVAADEYHPDIYYNISSITVGEVKSSFSGVRLGGTSDSVSSMPPYVTVYCWRRTA